MADQEAKSGASEGERSAGGGGGSAAAGEGAHAGATGTAAGPAAAAGGSSLSLKLEMSGGLELLFDGVKRHDLSVTATAAPGTPFTMRHLIAYVRDTMLKERPELFASEDTVRPGILVLINDADWELEGTLDYELQEGDEVAFISTLHGG